MSLTGQPSHYLCWVAGLAGVQQVIQRTTVTTPSVDHEQSRHCRRFQGFCNLLPKFFSAFPHGTCMLTVSWGYLAMDGMYHPFSASLPRSVTHISSNLIAVNFNDLDCHQPRLIFPDVFREETCKVGEQHITNRTVGFAVELFFFRSPLLKESMFVSFPQLTYMLKFSWYFCLNSDPMFECASQRHWLPEKTRLGRVSCQPNDSSVQSQDY